MGTKSPNDTQSSVAYLNHIFRGVLEPLHYLALASFLRHGVKMKQITLFCPRNRRNLQRHEITTNNYIQFLIVLIILIDLIKSK